VAGSAVGEVALEQRGLNPGDQIRAGQGEFDPGGVDRELPRVTRSPGERHALSSPVLASLTFSVLRSPRGSSTDLAALDKWDEYAEAKKAMLFYTDTADAPLDGHQGER
jgi:hypothetical protein